MVSWKIWLMSTVDRQTKNDNKIIHEVCTYCTNQRVDAPPPTVAVGDALKSKTQNYVALGVHSSFTQMVEGSASCIHKYDERHFAFDAQQCHGQRRCC